MSHGLIRGGGGVEFSEGYGAPGGRACSVEQFYKNAEKVLVMLVIFLAFRTETDDDY
jgi:hypothetical protein